MLDKDDFDFKKVPFKKVVNKIKITTYESIKTKLSFAEYVALRPEKKQNLIELFGEAKIDNR